ncbi:MAG: redoxin domain-containing protein [Vicingaceae bacterium]
MKTITSISAILLLLIGAALPGDGEIPSLAIGEKAPMTNHGMKSTKGKTASLESLKKEKGLLVIFSCNTCPFVIGNEKGEGWQGRYNELFELATSHNIGGVLVNSNEAKRDKGDSFKDMMNQAKDQNYQVDYVLDTDHLLADAFGAKTTPHIYLFDKDMKLVYKGAIDDNNASAAEVKEPWLKNALANLAASREIDPNTTRALGCSIKRLTK